MIERSKIYFNAKAEVQKLDAGDIMLFSNDSLDLKDMEKNKDKQYKIWGYWNPLD